MTRYNARLRLSNIPVRVIGVHRRTGELWIKAPLHFQWGTIKVKASEVIQ